MVSQSLTECQHISVVSKSMEQTNCTTGIPNNLFHVVHTS